MNRSYFTLKSLSRYGSRTLSLPHLKRPSVSKFIFFRKYILYKGRIKKRIKSTMTTYRSVRE